MQKSRSSFQRRCYSFTGLSSLVLVEERLYVARIYYLDSGEGEVARSPRLR